MRIPAAVSRWLPSACLLAGLGLLLNAPLSAQRQPQGAGQGGTSGTAPSGRSGPQPRVNPQPRPPGEANPPRGGENPPAPPLQRGPEQSQQRGPEQRPNVQQETGNRGPSPDPEFDMGPPSTPQQVAAALVGTPAIPPGPVQPRWESVKANYQVPEWFRDGKFGIMMHWGPYSVAAYHNEWYQKYIYGNEGIRDFHIKTFGPLDRRGYVSLIDQFGTKFKPDEWAELCRKAGATYVIPTAEHHDWFSLWDSEVSRWNSTDMGVKRDLIGELAREVRARGMKFGVSNHSIEHYTFINERPPESIPHDLDHPEYADFYWTHRSDEQLQKFLRLWVLKNYELIDKYQVDMLWFDNGVNHRVFDPLKLQVAAYYYNRSRQWGKQVTISSKKEAFLAGSILDLERQGRAPTELTDYVWQPDDPIGETFGYTTEDRGKGNRERDMAVGRPGTYITRLVQNVSRNGNYLLNISPRGDGTIPENQQRVLTAIGNWLQINGEAIYGTRPWKISEEGSVHFTTKGEVLYVMPVRAPGRLLQVPVLNSLGAAGKVAQVELLGTPGKLNFVQDETGLKVDLPESAAENAPFALKVTGLKLR